MKISFITPLIFFLTVQCLAQNKIVFEPAPVKFIIKNAGLKVNGSFNGLEGYILIDPETSTLLKIEGSIDASTIETGINLRDNHLKKRDYFNVKEYPRIFMTSTEIKKNSNRKYVGNFDLTIKDIKKNVTIPFTLTTTGSQYFLKGELVLDRLDFSLGEESLILSDNVNVKLEFKTDPALK